MNILLPEGLVFRWQLYLVNNYHCSAEDVLPNAFAIAMAFSNVLSSEALMGLTVANFFFCLRDIVKELKQKR